MVLTLGLSSNGKDWGTCDLGTGSSPAPYEAMLICKRRRVEAVPIIHEFPRLHWS